MNRVMGTGADAATAARTTARAIARTVAGIAAGHCVPGREAFR